MNRKILAGGTVVLLAVAGLFATAQAASAHTGDLNVTYSCDATTGEYVGTATLDISQTGLNGTTQWEVGNTNFTGTPNSNAGLGKGPVASTGAGTITLGSFRIPGTTTNKGPWVYAHTTWSDDFHKGSDGQSYNNLAGDCLPPKPGDKVTTSEWVDGTWGCGDTTVQQTRTVTVVSSVLSEGTWVDGTPVVTTETQARTLAPEELKVAQSTDPRGPCFVPPTNTCTEYSQGPVGTNLNGLWSNVDTRSAGHYEYVEDNLHIWTDDNSSNAKVSLGTAASFPLKNTGVLDLDWNGSTPPPGINLFVNFGADGNGTLVYESVYDQDLWLTNGSSAAVKANAPVNGGGNGSQWHGTIDQWLTKYPDASVYGIAFSLGSGVLGDGEINSITAGCKTYTFDYVEPAVQPEPVTETDETVVYGEWSTPTITCDSEVGDEQTLTRTVTTTPSSRTTGEPTYDQATNTWTQGPFGPWVEGEPVVTQETSTYVVTAEDIEALDCVISLPKPTPTPTAVVVAPKLAVTGGNGINPLIPTAGLLALLSGAIALGIRRNRATR